MNAEEQNRDRARGVRLAVLIAAGALPLLVSCSSSSSVEYVADAFPSQSLVDLLKESKSSSPPAPSETPRAPSATAATSPPPTSMAPPAGESPPVSATATNPPPSAANDDPVAAAFPSVSLIDLLTGRKPDTQ